MISPSRARPLKPEIWNLGALGGAKRRPRGSGVGYPAEIFRRQAGFTLIELLVVLVILGLLAGLVGPKVLGYLDSSRIKTAHLQIEELGAALDLYKLDNGSYPDSSQGLTALVTAPSGASRWHGPYLAKGKLPDDPWGHAYHYRRPGQHGDYDLFSYGSDDKEGGEGEAQDVTSW